MAIRDDWHHDVYGYCHHSQGRMMLKSLFNPRKLRLRQMTYQQWYCKLGQYNEARHHWEYHQWTWTFWCWIDQLMNHHFAQLSTMDLLKFCSNLQPTIEFLTFDGALVLDNVIFHVSISIVVWCTPAVFQNNSEISWGFESFRNQWSLKIDFDIQNFFQCQYRWLWN